MKRVYLLVILCFSFCGLYAQTPFPTWAHAIGGSGDDDIIQAICTDPAGNVYIGGSFGGTVDFDQGPGLAEATGTDFSHDAFLAKYNSDGVFQWVNTWGGDGDDEVRGLVADGGSVYAVGYFSGSSAVDFDDQSGSTTRTPVGLDMFLVKFNSATSELSFVHQLGGLDNDYATGVALDASGNIYICGNFYGSVDFDPSISNQFRNSLGGFDMILARYSNSGAYSWASALGSSQDDFINGIYVQGANVFIGGQYGEGVFHADPNSFGVTLDNGGGYDGYWGQYIASTGALQVGANIASIGDDGISAVWADATSLYTAGFFSGNAQIYGQSGNTTLNTNGGIDAFFARHNIVGNNNLVYVKQIGGIGDDYFNWISGDGTNLYVAGTSDGNLNMDPVSNTAPVTNQGDYDVIYGKYAASSGAFINGFGLGDASEEQGTCVVTDATGNIYLSGVFAGNIDFDPSSAVMQRSTAGFDDGFFVKYFQGTEPLNQPTNITFPNITGFGFSVSYNAAVGPASGYIGIYKVGSAPTGTPTDGVAYNALTQIGDGFVLFSGPPTSWNLTGLDPSAHYYIKVFSYLGSGASINYKTTTPLAGDVTTLAQAAVPTSSAENFSSSAITNTGFTVTYTAGTTGPAGYLVTRSTVASPTSVPENGKVYTVAATIGGDVVAYVGSGLTFTETSLSPGTKYYYKVFSYNGSGGSTNYRTIALEGNVTTFGSAEPSANPTALNFSNVTATGFNATYTLVAGTSGAIGLMKAGSAPTFVPPDNVELAVGTNNSDGSVVAFASNNGTFTLTGGTPSTTYYFAVFSYNGSGTNINYRQTSPLIQSITTLTPPPDTSKPVVTDNTSGTTPPNVSVKITVTATDNVAVSSVKITYHPLTSNVDVTSNMTAVSGAPNQYEFTIEAAINTELGLEYYIQAADAAGNKNDIAWKQIIVEYTGDTGLTVPFSAGTQPINYRIISVPLNLAKKSVSDVIGDDFGEYDKTKYRLFGYNGTAATELNGGTSIELGKGYWFIAAESKTFDTGAGTTAPAGTGKPIAIRISNGWNLIGNPYNFNVKWNDVIAANPDKTSGPIRVFKGSWGIGDLEKTSGGFIHVTNAGDQNLVIPRIKSARTYEPTPENFEQVLSSDTWAVDLLLKSGSVTNQFGGFGMHPNANEETDRYDDFTIPRFMQYLELNHHKKFLNSNYTKDIVPTSNKHVWEFEVESNVDDELMELEWDNSYFGSTDRELVLFDVDQQRAIDMKTERSYSFQRGLSRRFRAYFGGKDFVKSETLPYSAVFHSASPVPASSGQITFAFSVPETNGAVSTNVSIYNVMGQKVANLIDRPLPGGYNQAVWNIEDGTKPAAGVYISVLKFGDTTLQKRLIIR